MKQDKKPYLSVIVPIYNQETTIIKNLQAILLELEALSTSSEVIAVNDGSTDASLANAKKIKSSKLTVVGYKHNKGKGYAVRFGMAKAKGEIIGFIDSGGDIRESGIAMMIEHFKWYKADIVIGSKRHPVSKVNYPLYRKILSWGYQLMIRLLFGMNIRDSQVGLKLFKRKLLEEVLPRLLVKQFAFDIEILAVAYHLGYKRIFEAPVDLDFSKVSSTITSKTTLKTIFNMLRDTLAVFYRLRIKKYYDDHSHRVWVYDPELNFRVNTGK